MIESKSNSMTDPILPVIAENVLNTDGLNLNAQVEITDRSVNKRSVNIKKNIYFNERVSHG